MKTTILWLSRHNMTTAQLDDLKRIYGDIQIIHCDQTVNSYRDVLEAGKDCDILAVVLPPAMIADLVNPRLNTKPVIRARANRVATGNKILNPATRKEENEYKFEHVCWEQIKKIEIITQVL